MIETLYAEVGRIEGSFAPEMSTGYDDELASVFENVDDDYVAEIAVYKLMEIRHITKDIKYKTVKVEKFDKK